MLGSPFGQETSWPRSDLIAVSREFTPELVLAAYRSGVFPMPVRRGLMGWYSPLARGVIPLDALIRGVLGDGSMIGFAAYTESCTGTVGPTRSRHGPRMRHWPVVSTV